MSRSQFFMEWLRSSAVEGGAATFGQTEIKTPVGRANNLAMAIHAIEFEHESPLDTVADGDRAMCQLAMNSKAAEIYLNDSDLIAKWIKDFGLVTSGAVVHEGVKRIDFYPPLLYAKSSIYFGCKGVGSAGAKTYYTRIGYTLRYVSPTRMVQALVD